MTRGFPDYYAILNIDENATRDDIRRAYMRESLISHPDRSTAPDATSRFQAVADAYYILSDPPRRQEYDRARRSQDARRQWAEQHGYNSSTDSAPISPESEASSVFGSVFEELLRPEVDDPSSKYAVLGTVAGGILGFI